MFDGERAARAALSFLRDTIGQMVTLPLPREERVGDGEEGRRRWVAPPPKMLFFSFVFFFAFLFLPLLFFSFESRFGGRR